MSTSPKSANRHGTARRRTTGRALAAVLAVTAAASLWPLAGTASAATQPPSETAPSEAESSGSGLSNVSPARYAGDDRYATALAVAEEVAYEHGRSLRWVVVVSGTSWRDAVVAAPLATALDAATDLGPQRSAPILLAHPSTGLSDDALEFLDWTGAEAAVVVSTATGDRAAVPSSVDAQLRGRGVDVTRYGSDDPYRTAAEVASAVVDGAGGRRGRIAVLPGDSGRGTVFVASGEVFADALVAGPVAGSAAQPHPVLLTPRDGLAAAARGWISERRPGRVVILGGTAAVSDTTEAQIAAAGGSDMKIERIAGRDRFETAVLLADWAADRFAGPAFARDYPDCYSGGSGGEFPASIADAGLARGDLPWDSFAAAPLLALRCAPLLLAKPADAGIPDSTRVGLDEFRAAQGPTGVLRLSIIGGQAAVADTAVEAWRADSPADRTHAKRYRERSRDSVLPATDEYFVDYQALLDSYEVCPPPRTSDAVRKVFEADREHRAILKGFDTEIVMGPFAGKVVWFPIGWWTDDSLRHYYGNKWPRINVAWAKRNVTRINWNQVAFGDGFPAGGYGLGQWQMELGRNTPGARHLMRAGWPKHPSPFYWDHNGWRTKPIAVPTPTDDTFAEGFEDEWRNWNLEASDITQQWSTHTMQFPPVSGEPPAWAIYDIGREKSENCVVGSFRTACAITPDNELSEWWDVLSPFSRNDDRGHLVGSVYRSIVCGERPRWWS